MSGPLGWHEEAHGPGARRSVARRRLRRVALACSAVVVTGAAVTGVSGLAGGGRGPDQIIQTDATPHSARPTPTTGATESTTCTPRSATALALLTLTWDTGTQSRLDQIHRVIARADTGGDDATGLVQDLDSYLPTDAVWQQLTRYQTRQTATITSLRTPRSWPANRARLSNSIAAFTVQAIRRRDGELDGTPTSASSALSFTIFVTCPAGSHRYRLLRLSQLDDPLP